MNKRICAALSAVVFLCSSLCFTAGAENSGEAATEPQNGMTAIAENSNYIMLADSGMQAEKTIPWFGVA